MASQFSSALAALNESARSLEHSLLEFTEVQARGASLLPGWSRGHVLTHIARNADALLNLVSWARTGVETPMYPSREARDSTIEAQSGRPVAALVDDVKDSQVRLMTAIEAMTESELTTVVRWGMAGHEAPASDITKFRRMEVEVHHVDLDLDYTLAHWPEDLVESLLTEVAAEFAERSGTLPFVLVGNDDEGRWSVGTGGPEINGPPPALLGWLIGRTDGIGLHSDLPLPELGVWR